jgi:hypothetical protein
VVLQALADLYAVKAPPATPREDGPLIQAPDAATDPDAVCNRHCAAVADSTRAQPPTEGNASVRDVNRIVIVNRYARMRLCTSHC